jgi:hypothetical protein
MDKYCDKCRPAEEMIPEDHDVIGQVSDTDIHKVLRYEDHALEEGDYLYHYFADNDIYLEFIKKNLVTSSTAQCMCKECIERSMETEEPHYGDGAYATLNHTFSPQLTVINSVTRAHGIKFEERHFRAKIRIINPSAFRKFQRTGGVVRSILPKDKIVLRGKYYYFSRGDAMVISIEEWDGTRWMPAAWR